jgi:hypothetical protein
MNTNTETNLTTVAESAKQTAAMIRTGLRNRTGLRYSVTLGRGTAAHHIYISAGKGVDETAARSALSEILSWPTLGHPLWIVMGHKERLAILTAITGGEA